MPLPISDREPARSARQLSRKSAVPEKAQADPAKKLALWSPVQLTVLANQDRCCRRRSALAPCGSTLPALLGPGRVSQNLLPIANRALPVPLDSQGRSAFLSASARHPGDSQLELLAQLQL